MKNLLNKRNKFNVWILRLQSPGYSYCSKCGLPWNHCTSKSVMTSATSGTFATCDICWNNSTLDELKKCYTDVYKMQYESSIRDEYMMNHTLEHLLECVEKEYQKAIPIIKFEE